MAAASARRPRRGRRARRRSSSASPAGSGRGAPRDAATPRRTTASRRRGRRRCRRARPSTAEGVGVEGRRPARSSPSRRRPAAAARGQRAERPRVDLAARQPRAGPAGRPRRRRSAGRPSSSQASASYRRRVDPAGLVGDAETSVAAVDGGGRRRRARPGGAPPGRGRSAGRAPSRPGRAGRRSPRARRAAAGPGRPCASSSMVAAERQVGRRLGVPEHHVGAVVDELAGPSLGPGHRPQRESARPGPARPIEPGAAAARSGGRTAIRAVASVWPYITTRSKPLRWPSSAYLQHPLGSHPAAGLGEVAQRRARRGRRSRCGRGGRRCAGRRGSVVTEYAATSAQNSSSTTERVRQQQRGAGEQVGVQHRQAVAVVQGQRGRRDVGRADAERLDDRPGVGEQAVGGEPDELGRARRAGGGQQQGSGPGAGRGWTPRGGSRRVAGGDHHVRVVRRGQPVERGVPAPAAPPGPRRARRGRRRSPAPRSGPPGAPTAATDVRRRLRLDQVGQLARRSAGPSRHRE